jgi:tetratricopeptide (TPR) repeat protein
LPTNQIWIRRLWRSKIVLVLMAGLLRSQAPSHDEQRYLASILPLIQQQKCSEAESKLKQGLSQFPRSALLANALGMVEERQEKFDAAAQDFERALEWLPSFTAAQIHLAEIYGKQGNCAKASRLFNAAASDISDSGALTTIGVGLGECQAYGDAARVLEKAHGLDPTSATITWNLALAQFKSGAFEEALRSLDALPRESESERSDVLYLRGKIFEALKRPEASGMLAQACRAKPQDDSCEDAAILLMRQDRLSDAADVLERAKALQPSATILSTLGLVQFRLGRYRQAIESYTRAIDRDPTLTAPREGLGFLLYMTGDLEGARRSVEDALKQSSANFYLPYLQALILWRMSHRFSSDALNAIAASLQENPRFAPAYFLRGKIRLDANATASALADFEQASRLDPNYALPWYKMAQIYYREGQPEKAKEAEQRFIALGSLREEEVLAKEAQDALAPVLK